MVLILPEVEDKPKSTKQILFEQSKPPKSEEGEALGMHFVLSLSLEIAGNAYILFIFFAEKESEYFSKPGGKWEGLPTNELALKPPDKLTNIL